MHKTVFAPFILAFLVFITSCQTQPVIMTTDYTVNENFDNSRTHIFVFQSEHELSMMGLLQQERVLDDTIYYFAFSNTKDTLHILNSLSGKLHSISFKHLISYGYYGIESFYYHNHDSIFLFLDRFTVAALNRRYNKNYKDILLVNGKGELQSRYNIDSLPNVYYDSLYYGCLHPWEDALNERMFAGGILIDLTPKITKEHLNSPLQSSIIDSKAIACCKLKDNTIHMLGIRRPEALYGKFEYPPEMWVKVLNAKEMLVGFSASPIIYHYNIESDTMLPLDIRYDFTFATPDSASMVKGKDYPSTLFCKPVWRACDACYVRKIIFRHYKNYKNSCLVELLDSNFNHIGYVCADVKRGWNNLSCHEDGSITVTDRGSYGRHALILSGKMHKTRLSALERRSMVKKPQNTSAKSKPMRFSQVLQALQVRDSSISIVINLKYPCGSCMENLANFYREHQQTMEKQHIFYVYYDPETSDDAAVRNILKNHGIHSRPLKSTILTSNVYSGC